MPSSHLLAAVREFTTTILDPYDLAAVLHRLTDHAATVADAQGAGVMLAGKDNLGFAAASNDEIINLEVTQDRIEDGPCHAAYRTDQWTVVDDLEAELAWPEYRQRALQLGFRSVIAVPMRAWGQTIGTLDIYRKSVGPWSEDDRDATEILTAMAAGYILHANQMTAQHELAEQLQTALQTRDMIGQAKGLLMAHHDIGANEAFDVLKATSQTANIKLRDVAAKIIDNAMSGAR